MTEPNIQEQFALNAAQALQHHENVVGLVVGGSWLTGALDEYADLDLIVVTKSMVSGNKELMFSYAESLGELLSGFTGEHVGEPRLLICLYQNPLLHVDIKFLSLDEFRTRVENPAILLDRDGQLAEVMERSVPHFPQPDFQWIEDRFWIWVHYMLQKIGRGELMEALDCFGFLRMTVFGPLLHIKNNNLPRGVRKVETALAADDLSALIATIPEYNVPSLLLQLRNAVALYRQLRTTLFDSGVELQRKTEQAAMGYFDEIEKGR